MDLNGSQLSFLSFHGEVNCSLAGPNSPGEGIHLGSLQITTIIKTYDGIISFPVSSFKNTHAHTQTHTHIHTYFKGKMTNIHVKRERQRERSHPLSHFPNGYKKQSRPKAGPEILFRLPIQVVDQISRWLDYYLLPFQMLQCVQNQQ